MAELDVEIRRALERLTPAEVDTAGVTDAVLVRHARRRRRRTAGAGLAAVCVAVFAGLGLATLVDSDTRQVVTGPSETPGDGVWLAPTWMPDDFELRYALDRPVDRAEVLVRARFGERDTEGWLLWEATVEVTPELYNPLRGELVDTARGPVRLSGASDHLGPVTIVWRHGDAWVTVATNRITRDAAIEFAERVVVTHDPDWQVNVEGAELLAPQGPATGLSIWLEVEWCHRQGGGCVLMHVYGGSGEVVVERWAHEQPRRVPVRGAEGTFVTDQVDGGALRWVESPGVTVTVAGHGLSDRDLVRFAEGLQLLPEAAWRRAFAPETLTREMTAEGELGPWRWERTESAEDPGDHYAVTVRVSHVAGLGWFELPPGPTGFDVVPFDRGEMLIVTVTEPIDAVVLVLADGTRLEVTEAGPLADPLQTIAGIWGNAWRSYWAFFDDGVPDWNELVVRGVNGEEHTVAYNNTG